MVLTAVKPLMRIPPMRIACSLLILGLVCQGWAADATKEAVRAAALKEADAKALAANLAIYKKDVQPFLEQHCIRCHGPKN